ncbi:phosphate ABC transporter ATP-binding protein [Pedobacter hiemivivus]|uniref:Phosphate ABC transporter ATP-binding protein n=1 Tax=Pedobacter hiemivivus TaxID=2530454 RepID=A0A4V2MGU9_9SPHI|nr:phosphate ABC transporter ATP-binding protein PstB [Pedobacter hiemivivus]TCC84026.1 phosphate ABC transporter ATP-binding protein [Pedobacter hiemivivus]TKC58482.1 phosphate ABC transporter ATP-binding protein [Pedobacter hiemivivus]
MTNKPIKLSGSSVNVWFGSKQVLKNINVEFPRNQVTALIGPSGCGKSTLLRSFNRMHDLSPDARIEGEFLLEQQNLYEKGLSVTEVRRRIGMVFQKANPFPKSIYENINYGLKINDVPKNERSEIIENALKESYIWDEVKDELQKPATRLSGGQQQRLCIARAVALRPEVILMDEPCSALDPLSTLKIEELIVKLKKDYTIVIVTHNMQQAQRIADKTVFMYLGEVIEAGDTHTIFHNPKNELTGNYVKGHFG